MSQNAPKQKRICGPRNNDTFWYFPPNFKILPRHFIKVIGHSYKLPVYKSSLLQLLFYYCNLLQLLPKKFVGQLANVQVIRYPSSAGSLIQSDSAGSPFALSMIFL